MLETEDAHGGLLIDQVRTVNPGVNPVTVVFLTNGFVIVPEPETFTHKPVPIATTLPAKVAVAVPVVAQSVWLGPAFETVGAGRVVIVMFDVDEVQGELLIDHVNTVVPTVSPVIVEFGSSEFVITPGPETFIHLPIPFTGLFPANKAEPAVTQTV